MKRNDEERRDNERKEHILSNITPPSNIIVDPMMWLRFGSRTMMEYRNEIQMVNTTGLNYYHRRLQLRSLGGQQYCYHVQDMNIYR